MVITVPSSAMGCLMPLPQPLLPKRRLYSATNVAVSSQVWKQAYCISASESRQSGWSGDSMKCVVATNSWPGSMAAWQRAHVVAAGFDPLHELGNLLLSGRRMC